MLECDLIMKGGITSGVVYPHAIRKIATKYRLRSIGGTSAGAIAAAFAAAAEYRRQTGYGMAGYDAIGDVAKELGTDMKALFQPSQELEPLFGLIMAVISKPKDRGAGAALLPALPRVFPEQVGAGLFILALFLILAWSQGSWALASLGVLVAALVAVALIALKLKRLIFVDLPRADFGICPGKTQRASAIPAFGDWIARKIDLIAGKYDGDPLTVGDLRDCGVEVATMTTDLSSKRPYQLPLSTKIHFFSKREFERLFPDKLVRYLCEKGERREPRPEDPKGVPDDLYRLPVGDDFPVYLVARLSLSFPGLISGVPLWRIDYTSEKGDHRIRRCLFSDGGISSNFPIHFFDALLPRRPTFGIALDSYDEARHESRTELPGAGRQSTALPVENIDSIPGFVWSILNTAKDWQDKMQSLLPGYAERIVTVRLDDSAEGGMNLAMNETTIGFLTELGARAGERLVDEFDMDQHRYDRAISLLPTIEAALASMDKAYRSAPDGSEGALTFAKVLTDFETKRFTRNTKKWRKDPFARLAGDLAKIGKRANELHGDPSTKSVREGRVPSVDAVVRLVAVADRVPRDAEEES